MSEFHALRRDGTPWQPMFVEEINGETCIGCGRCFNSPLTNSPFSGPRFH
jgi:ferredoxin